MLTKKINSSLMVKLASVMALGLCMPVVLQGYGEDTPLLLLICAASVGFNLAHLIWFIFMEYYHNRQMKLLQQLGEENNQLRRQIVSEIGVQMQLHQKLYEYENKELVKHDT